MLAGFIFDGMGTYKAVVVSPAPAWLKGKADVSSGW
jgi:hypothetical protein